VSGTPFFEEGIAAVFGTRRLMGVMTVERPDAMDSLDLGDAALRPWTDHDYAELQLGQHFVGWLARDYPDELRRFLDDDYDDADVSAVLQASLGFDLPEAQVRWEGESADAYAFSDMCDGLAEATTDLGPEGRTRAGSVDCEDPETVALTPAVLQDRCACFRLTTPTELTLSLTASVGQLILRPLDCPTTPRIVVLPGDDTILTAAACTWSVVYSSNEGPSEFSYRVTVAPSG
jgi:hypothetical protein